MSDCRHVFTAGMGPDCTGRASIWKCDDCGRLGVVVYPPSPGAPDPCAALLAERDELREALRAEHNANRPFDAGPGCGCSVCRRWFPTSPEAEAADRALLSRHPAQPVKGTL